MIYWIKFWIEHALNFSNLCGKTWSIWNTLHERDQKRFTSQSKTSNSKLLLIVVFRCSADVSRKFQQTRRKFFWDSEKLILSRLDIWRQRERNLFILQLEKTVWGTFLKNSRFLKSTTSFDPNSVYQHLNVSENHQIRRLMIFVCSSMITILDFIAIVSRRVG